MPMNPSHDFAVSVEWLGNRGEGTSGPRAFGREHRVTVPGKPALEASAARAFRGDADRWNPEEELVAALAQCHLLSYLFVATRAGVVVVDYRDEASGTLRVEPDGSGRMTEVVLRPVVTIEAGDEALAHELHAEARRLCFIANSVAFPVRHEPRIQRAGGAPGDRASGVRARGVQASGTGFDDAASS